MNPTYPKLNPQGRKFVRGTKLAARMDVLGYRMRDVAEGAGVDRFSLNDYLHQRRRISPAHLHRLARFLHCEPETLYE